MTDIIYRIVPHDGGWAYTLDGVFSETFADRGAAEAAARRAAAEQELPGETVGIRFEDETGAWREELSDGDDRPTTHVEG
ncbi:MAG TPA: DUF2188 domain-containing protein [Caulobacter sp.]|nr:DUF2188 domain-containing protein [Caulobacter sp.]